MSLDPTRMTPTERREYESDAWLGEPGLLSPSGKVHALSDIPGDASDIEFTLCGQWAYLGSGWGKCNGLVIDCLTCRRLVRSAT